MFSLKRPGYLRASYDQNYATLDASEVLMKERFSDTILTVFRFSKIHHTSYWRTSLFTRCIDIFGTSISNSVCSNKLLVSRFLSISVICGPSQYWFIDFVNLNLNLNLYLRLTISLCALCTLCTLFHYTKSIFRLITCASPWANEVPRVTARRL